MKGECREQWKQNRKKEKEEIGLNKQPTIEKEIIMKNICIIWNEKMNLCGGEQTETLPGGGFHGGEQTETLPGGGFHGRV